MTLTNDLRHGLRMLFANPGFTLITVLSIGVGVGANAATFSLADALLLRPLAVPRSAGVLSVVGSTPQSGGSAPLLSYPDYLDLRERTTTFESLVAFRDVLTAFDVRRDRPALRTLGAAVSGNFFDAMGVRPALGRFFRADEDAAPGRDAVIVLDHRVWTERFGGDPAVLGRRVRIADTDFTVIGVSAAAFKGLAADVWPTFYVPLAMLAETQLPRPADLTRRDVRALEVKGRLKPGVTLAQAREETARIGADLARTYPETNRSSGMLVTTELALRMTGPDAVLVAMLLSLSVAVLLVACANVAGLLASRAPTRAREVALRLAIGAGRFRLMRQLMTESLLLAVGGAAVGLTLAYGGITLFRRIEFPTEVPLKLVFELDARVLTLGLLAAFISTMVSSLIPAWQTTRTDLVTTIKSGSSSTRVSRQWGRHGLVCMQVALSLVLLTVASAMYVGFRERMIEGPGFRRDGLLLARFDERLTRYDRRQAQQFFDLLEARALALPGVTSVAFTSSVPLKTDTGESMRVAPEGVRLPDDAADVRVRSSRVSDGYFGTLDIPVLEGRGIARADNDEAPRVAVVNQAFAGRYWPDGSAVGKRLRVTPPGGQSAPDWYEIVGVAGNIKLDWLGETPQEMVYLSRRQSHALDNTVMIRTTGDAAALAAPIRALVQEVDPAMPVFGVRTMADLYQARGIAVPNVLVRTVGAMGGMGLVLALVGLYGLVAYAVSRRTREIGIRMAVGAVPLAILALVLRRGVILIAIGLLLGLAGSIAVGRLLSGALPGVAAPDPALYATVVVAVLAVTSIAALIPARRAAGLDPLRALRVE